MMLLKPKNFQVKFWLQSIILGLLCITFFSHCSKPQLGLTIKVQGNFSDSQKIYLVLVGIGNVYVIDSTFAAKGQCSFYRKNTQDDQLWSIVYDSNKEILFINDAPRITIKTSNHSKLPWKFENSIASSDIQLLDYYFKMVNLRLDSIRYKMINAIGNDSHYQSFKLQYQLELAKVQQTLSTFTENVKHPMLAFFVIGKSLDYLKINDTKKLLQIALKKFPNQFVLIKTKTYLDLLEKNNPNFKPIY